MADPVIPTDWLNESHVEAMANSSLAAHMAYAAGVLMQLAIDRYGTTEGAVQRVEALCAAIVHGAQRLSQEQDYIISGSPAEAEG